MKQAVLILALVIASMAQTSYHGGGRVRAAAKTCDERTGCPPYGQSRLGPFADTTDLTYYIYRPEPKPATAPVVFVWHGWQATQPNAYEAAMQFVARWGAIVVWIEYQKGDLTAGQYVPNSAQGYDDALARINGDTATYPTHNGYVISVGHSVGGLIAAYVATLRPVHAIWSFDPGGLVPAVDLSTIPSGTTLGCTTGGADTVVCEGGCATIFAGTSQIPDRQYVVVYDSSSGAESISTQHQWPTTATEINNADYFALWWRVVTLVRCVTAGVDCKWAKGNGSPEQLFMGRFLDRTLVTPMKWFPFPPASPALACSGG